MFTKVWGSRGSIPTPGERTKKYGGNTSCVECRIGDKIFVFDAGSGLRELGLSLMEEFKGKPITLHLFISHTHWDHIQGFPFFIPFYVPNNNITIYGGAGFDKNLEHLLTNQMDSNYFPVGLGELSSNIKFVNLVGLPVYIDDAKLTTHYLNHPGLTLGFRIDYQGKTVVYALDNEPYSDMFKLKNSDYTQEDLEFSDSLEEKYIEFIHGADILYADAQYTKEEYKKFIGYGHSFLDYTVGTAIKANVKKLIFFHHDPMHTDEIIDKYFDEWQNKLKEEGSNLILECAREGQIIEI
ncbi:MAG: MBL fold metallo-hydrolase [Pseudomonadota bacterium]